jgi:DNA processing protein
MEAMEAWIALSLIRGVGETTLRRLVEVFGSPEEVFRVSATQLQQLGKLNQPVADRIVQFSNSDLIADQMRLMERHGTRLLTFLDNGYPENLRQLDDSPPVLYVKGKMEREDARAVALVGSRKATVYGKLMAQKLAAGLVRAGITIVSGMARGIDTTSHRTALDQGGRTVAVLGCGVDVVYPPENRALMQQIAKRGAVISEFPMGTKPLAGHFPTRNRIISGLSLGVVAVEASEASGVFSTAKWAADQGRDVFAVPGNVSSRMSSGTNILIKHGAKLTTDVADILEELNIEPAAPTPKILPALSNEERTVLQILNSTPQYVDYIREKANLPVSRTLSVLLSLEIKELVFQLPGKLFVKKGR